MAFTGSVITLAALMQIELPMRTIRMTDGGFVYWDGHKYDCFDEDFGTIAGAEAFEEKTGDEAPGGKLIFYPPSSAAAASLSQPEYQGSRLRFWLAEIDPQTGTVTGTPELTADLALDTVTLKAGKGTRAAEMEFESAAKRLFMVLRGQALNDRFHQSCYPGEKGMANATGMPRSTPWGAKDEG